MEQVYRLLIAYDGTAYGGWQIQPNSQTIQAEIEKALKIILQKQTTLIGSGRTDAGVHARGQCAHFASIKRIDPVRLRASLNALLPVDIRILAVEPVARSFHARYSAISKIYHYHLRLGSARDPFTRLYTTRVHHSIDMEKLKMAAPLFLGTHDFTSFANEAHRGSAAKNPIKTLTRLDVHAEPEGIRLEFEADGFLYKMVRNIMGTLIAIASGKASLERIPLLFAAKDRRQGAMSAPPQGLFLHRVIYPDFSPLD